MGRAGPAISISTETKVLALLARGDSRQEIMDQIEGGITAATITNIKKRNKENLVLIAERVQAKAEEDAVAANKKANKKIIRRLDGDDLKEQVLLKAHQEYLDDKITLKEYKDLVRVHRELTVGELVTVSKEMYHQGKEGASIPKSPADIASLVAAIKSGDETKITQVVFGGQSQPSSS